MDRFVVKIKRTVFACPEVWEGELNTGEKIKARIRFGYGYLEVEDITVAEFTAEGDSYLGMFPEGKLLTMFEEAEIQIDPHKLNQF